MSEREGQEKSREHVAYICEVPKEVVFRGDGEREIVSDVYVIAKDDKDAKEVFEAYGELTGSEPVSDLKHIDTSSSTHHFSSRNWNAPWNPEGPKPNWRKGSSNPSAN